MSKKSWKRWRCAERCHLCHISPGLPRFQINKIAMDASKFDECVPVSCSRNKYGLVLMMTQLKTADRKKWVAELPILSFRAVCCSRNDMLQDWACNESSTQQTCKLQTHCNPKIKPADCLKVYFPPFSAPDRKLSSAHASLQGRLVGLLSGLCSP